MFNLFGKKKKEAPDFSGLKADMHSHLIPGVDDGSPDLASSLALIKGLNALGFTKLITTPHIMWDMYQNTAQTILEKLSVLQTELERHHIDVDISAAAEYFLDDHVKGLLQKKEPLLPISGNMVLVEFSMASPPIDLKEILFDMQIQGYQPVIAHPERYAYSERNKEFFEELKAAGYLFQLNLLSLAGFYGKSAHDLAHYLLKQDYYDLAGTDLHSARHLEALSHPSITTTLSKLLEKERLLNPTL